MKRNAAGWPAALESLDVKKRRLWIPGNRREKINPIRNEAIDDHEKHGNTTTGVYHNGGIISQENILCPNHALSDRIHPAHLDGSK
jgi:hypothetical protein